MKYLIYMVSLVLFSACWYREKSGFSEINRKNSSILLDAYVKSDTLFLNDYIIRAEEKNRKHLRNERLKYTGDIDSIFNLFIQAIRNAKIIVCVNENSLNLESAFEQNTLTHFSLSKKTLNNRISKITELAQIEPNRTVLVPIIYFFLDIADTHNSMQYFKGHYYIRNITFQAYIFRSGTCIYYKAIKHQDHFEGKYVTDKYLAHEVPIDTNIVNAMVQEVFKEYIERMQ